MVAALRTRSHSPPAAAFIQAAQRISTVCQGERWHGLLWFVGQYADGLVELCKDFLQAWVRLLHDEGSEVTGLALLHLGGLHDEGIAACIVVEPSDEQATAECLAPVARLADVEQNVGIGSEESLDEQEDGFAQFLVER